AGDRLLAGTPVVPPLQLVPEFIHHGPHRGLVVDVPFGLNPFERPPQAMLADRLPHEGSSSSIVVDGSGEAPHSACSVPHSLARRSGYRPFGSVYTTAPPVTSSRARPIWRLGPRFARREGGSISCGNCNDTLAVPLSPAVI